MFLWIIGTFYFIFRTELFKEPLLNLNSAEDRFVVAAIDMYILLAVVPIFKNDSFIAWRIPSALEIGIALAMLAIILIGNLLQFPTKFRRIFFKNG